MKINQYYDQEVPTDKYWNLYGLTRTEYKGTPTKAEKFVEIIREQLRKGGYIAVWVNTEGAGYRGKSNEGWTENIHWMAIIDYKVENGKEKIAIADARGVLWKDIDEFQSPVVGLDDGGVSAYALINEE